MRAAIDEMVARHAGERVVVVSHGAAIIAYLVDVLQPRAGQLRMLPVLHEHQRRAERWATGAWSARSATSRTSNERSDPPGPRSPCREKLGRPELRVMSVEPIPEGHSGFTYFVDVEDDDGPTRYVLRLPPPGARIAGPADVVRQGRIMSALHAAGLPTPAIPADELGPGRRRTALHPHGGGRRDSASKRPGGEQGDRHRDVRRSTSSSACTRCRSTRPGIGDEESVGLQAEMMRWAMLMQRAPEELTTRAGELGGLLAVQTAGRTCAHPRPRRLPLRQHAVPRPRGGRRAGLGDRADRPAAARPRLPLHRRDPPPVPGRAQPGGAIDVSVEDLYRLYGVDPKRCAGTRR